MMTSMEAGKRYIVTRASDDGTFEVGDHINKNPGGSINCQEAGGWIEACDAEEATRGMECEIDQAWVARRREKLLAELAELAD